MAQGQTLVVRAEGDTPIASGDAVGLGLPARRLRQFAADGRTVRSGLGN